jgi:peptidyl-dipeptidase Dcp
VAGKLLGVEFKRNDSHPKYHPDTAAYDVFDKETGKREGVIYTDLYARPNKNSGAWMNQMQTFDEGRPAIVTLNMNQLKPEAGKPCPITLSEAQTVFHELGHAMHGLLGHRNVRHKMLQGTNVSSDFVELHSMLLENWVGQRETLDMFARHGETGAKVPVEMVEALKRSESFFREKDMLFIAQAAKRDFLFHSIDPANYPGDVKLQEMADLKHHYAPHLRAHDLHRFTHLFQGDGYAARYYGYLWADMLQACVFEHFGDEALFDPAESAKLGRLYREGSSRDPNLIFEAFNGRPATPDALLREAGIVPNAEMERA